MSADALYRTWGLEGYRVFDARLSDADGRLRVLVEAPREGLSCRVCGCSRVHVHERVVRTWHSAPIGLKPVGIVLNSPKVKCLDWGPRPGISRPSRTVSGGSRGPSEPSLRSN